MERNYYPTTRKKSPINAHARIRSFVMNIVNDKLYFQNDDDWQPIKDLLQKKEISILLQNVNGFICIYNYKKNIYEYVSENLRTELGYDPESFLGEKGAEYMLRIFDENQIPLLVKITEETLQYLSANATYETGRDFRHTSCMKFKNIYNEFIWFMVDKSMIQVDQNGFPIRALLTCTNINAFKKDETLYYNILKKDMNNVYQSVWQGYIYEKKEKLEEELTKREIEIVQLIAEGFTNAQIGEKLFISLATVQTHRKNILKKTQCKGTAELTRLAFSRGMI